MEDYKKKEENRLNQAIEDDLKAGRLDSAMIKCEKFLRQAYGDRTFGFWALRDFYKEFVAGKVQTRFDQNLDNLFKLRDVKVAPKVFSQKYESPYLSTDDQKMKFDDLYEEFLNRTTKRRCMASFLKFIEDQLDEAVE